MNKKLYGVPVLAAILVALVIAGCGGGSSSTSTTETSSGAEAASSGSEAGEKEAAAKAAPNAEEGTTFVSLGNVSGLGMVLVDSRGLTLYDFQKDKGPESTCYGQCEGFWPPLLTKGKPQPSNGADGSMLGTTERKDGSMQVTYAGHPLYLFSEDTKPGEASGNDVDFFGGEWYAVNKEGGEPSDEGSAEDSSSEAGSTEGSSGYSGY